MIFRRYDDANRFRSAVYHILMQNEAENNLPLSIITENGDMYSSKWLLATVNSDDGSVLLTAICTPPFNLLLYAAKKSSGEVEAHFLADALKAEDYEVTGVLAERTLARAFSLGYAGEDGFYRHMTMNIMRLDRVSAFEKSSGFCRALSESDMFFAPYWERAFSEECRAPSFSIEENTKRIESRLGKDTHLFWEVCGVPVSQAVCGRCTLHSAVISSVYTPPHYRGHGYAASVVAEISAKMLRRGKKFCCLFADADNPVSCGLYRKIGYYDVCTVDDIRLVPRPG